MDEENQTPLVEEIKKEKVDDEEVSDHEDLRSIDHSFDNELEETASIKNESIEKDMSENAKSDDDMQGYRLQ